VHLTNLLTILDRYFRLLS